MALADSVPNRAYPVFAAYLIPPARFHEKDSRLLRRPPLLFLSDGYIKARLNLWVQANLRFVGAKGFDFAFQHNLLLVDSAAKLLLQILAISLVVTAPNSRPPAPAFAVRLMVCLRFFGPAEPPLLFPHPLCAAPLPPGFSDRSSLGRWLQSPALWATGNFWRTRRIH